MAEPRDPVEQLIRTLLDRERLANGLTVAQKAELQRLFEDIAEILRRIDPPGPARSRYRRARTEKALAEIQRRLREYAPAMERAFRDALAPIGRRQAEAAATGLVATLGTEVRDLFTVDVGITQQRLRAILNSDPFRGRLLREHTQTFTARQYVRARDAIRLGMTNEEPVQDIVDRVLGRPVGYQSTVTGKMRKTGGPRARRLYAGGVLAQAERNAEALVRTSVTHVSNVGAMATYEANADILEGIQFVATLDDRTTVICLSYDGRVWPLDSDDLQRPPLHYNCRSILVPVVAWKRLGLEPPPGGDRIARDLSGATREELRRPVSARRSRGGFGPVEKLSSNTVGTEWLRRQPKVVQDEILGRGLADLFRSGDLTLADLVRRDNTVRTLGEIR